MSDDKSKRVPADSSRINIHEDYEVRYWCQKFSCTREQLLHAVGAIGAMAENVERYLEARR